MEASLHYTKIKEQSDCFLPSSRWQRVLGKKTFFSLVHDLKKLRWTCEVMFYALDILCLCFHFWLALSNLSFFFCWVLLEWVYVQSVSLCSVGHVKPSAKNVQTNKENKLSNSELKVKLSKILFFLGAAWVSPGQFVHQSAKRKWKETLRPFFTDLQQTN